MNIPRKNQDLFSTTGMHILLLGIYGQLGYELQRTLQPLGQLFALDYPDIDLARPQIIREIIQEIQPKLIINATAYTAVDRAEQEPELAMAINAHAAGVLAEAAAKTGAALVHYSTDYVFDGNKGSPYLESDTPNPINSYGRSKLAGEMAIQSVDCAYLILRTSWVYSLRRDSFVTKVLQWSQNQPVLRVVTDQVGNPTWARMLAEITAQLLAMSLDNPYNWVSKHRGVYHLAGSGFASRFEWAVEILRHAQNREREINPALTQEFVTPAQRPLFSALNCDLFTSKFGLKLPRWQDALLLAMDEVSA